jgi:shikimate dehydrogenase
MMQQAPQPITAGTKLVALLGDPVAQSLSPRLHNYWFAAHGIDAAYLALPVKQPGAIGSIAGLGFVGANVTVPHKEAAFKQAAQADAAATALQAANVLKCEADGSLSAFNTDGRGFALALDKAFPEWRLVRRRHVIVVGAGGSARAVCSALIEAGVPRIFLVNRTLARAEQAAALLGEAIQPMALADLADRMGRTDLVVNTITDDSALDWPFERARARPLCVDLRYGAMKTRFLEQARVQGLPIFDGLSMLVHQAALSFEIWFGQRPDVDEGLHLLQRDLP